MRFNNSLKLYQALLSPLNERKDERRNEVCFHKKRR
jgi:hypothetical protein